MMDAVVSWFEKLMKQQSVEWIEGLQSGDPEVLDGLIAVYQHRLFRYLLSITGNRAAAEDLFQETWLHVLERGHQYRSQWKFDVWLFSIARHLAIDLARRKTGRSLDEMMDPDEGAGFEPPAHGPSPFDEVQAQEESEQMQQILGRIPAGYREALTLRFQEDLDFETMTAIIGAPLSTVKSRLYRGLEAVRKIIGGKK